MQGHRPSTLWYSTVSLSYNSARFTLPSMSDPLRTETSRAHDAVSRADREAKIEQLLLAGLDHYFAQQYDQAINVWTRVLFLDRSHARARAYIERARSAQAERLRESEALLHDGASAVRRGDSTEARRLLDAAMEHGGPSDELLALLDRVERLEHSTTVSDLSDDATEEPRLSLDPSAAASTGRSWQLGGLLALGLIGVLVAVSLMRGEWEPLVERALARRVDRGAGQASPSPVRRDATLPIPRRADAALTRAQALVSGGKLHDALPLLESIRATDPERADADRIRADVQRQLLALASSTQPPSTPRPADGSRP